MSLFGAMFSGVSGLSAQSQAMAMISDNISNVNTVGYKGNVAAFSTLVTQSSFKSVFSPGGVRADAVQLVNQQGLIQRTQSVTDLAIQGNGFFVVNTLQDPTSTDGQFLYTRAGQFEIDRDGNLVNTGGHFLQGWPLDEDGEIPNNATDLAVLRTVNTNGLTGSAQATESIGLKANLQSTQPVSANIGSYVAGNMAAGTFEPDFESSVQIFDSQGGTRAVTFGFVKSATANQWNVEAYIDPDTLTDPGVHTNGLLASGTMAFNTDGSLDLDNTSAALLNLNITWNSSLGVDNSTITVNYGSNDKFDGITQFNGNSQMVSNDVDGAVFGSLSGIEVDDQGRVTALFTNGKRQDIFQLPIATFTNPNGLAPQVGNAYAETDESGDFTLNETGLGGAGKISPSSLEASTVDLATEFTNMIVTQRAFSASGKIISTADEMLDELVRLKR